MSRTEMWSFTNAIPSERKRALKRMESLTYSIYVALAFMTAIGSRTQTQDWSDYKPYTMVKASSETTVIKGTDYTIETKDVKYAVEVSYSGERRDVGLKRRELLRRWVKALRHPEAADIFEHEIRVHAGNTTFWLPLQNTLLEPLATEARVGSRLRLFIMYIGANSEDRLFVINEFQVLPK
jgi:hypothetical protein